MGRILAPLLGVVVFGGLSCLMIWGRPHSVAEERRRRRYNERNHVPAKDRIGDTRLGAWVFGVGCAGGAVFCLDLLIVALAR